MKKVQRLADMPHEERAKLQHYRAPRPEDSRIVNTCSVYEGDLVDLDAPKLSQSVEVVGLHALTEHEGAYEAHPVDSLMVWDDGSMYAVDAEREDLAEREGFVGYVNTTEDADELTSEELEELLEETRIEEDK